MADGLFRPEVYGARIEQGLGTVRIGTPRYSAVTALLLLSSTMVALIYLCTGTYARSVSASGYLVPEQATVKVGVEGGAVVVLAVHVREGTFVEVGDALLTLGSPAALDNADAAGRHRSYSDQLRSGYFQRFEQLVREDQNIAEQYRLSHARQRVELDQFDAQLKDLNAGRVLRVERLHMADSKSRALATLREQRVISELDWMDHQSLVLRLREELLSLEGEVARTLRQREAGVLGLAEIDAELARAQLQIAARRSELQMDQDRALVGIERVLLATKSGFVDSLEAQPGSLAQAGMPLLSIVSRNADLRARLLIPGTAVGFVESGQTVHLRFDAFPHQHFGTQAARLVSLSSAISPAGESVGPFRLSEPVYLGEALLENLQRKFGEQKVGLREGMRFTADLELEQRTLMQWLLEPLFARNTRRA